MVKIVYRQMSAPRELSQQMPASRAKARVQKPQGGGNFWCKFAGGGGGGGGWLWIKLISALQFHIFHGSENISIFNIWKLRLVTCDVIFSETSLTLPKMSEDF